MNGIYLMGVVVFTFLAICTPLYSQDDLLAKINLDNISIFVKDTSYKVAAEQQLLNANGASKKSQACWVLFLYEMQEGRDAVAYEYLKTGHEFDNTNRELSITFARLHIRKIDFEDQLALVSELTKTFPNPPMRNEYPIELLHATSLGLSGKHHDAEKLLVNSTDDVKNNFYYPQVKSGVLQALGKYNESLNVLNKGISVVRTRAKISYRILSYS